MRGRRTETPDEVVVEELLAFEPAEALAGVLDIEVPAGDGRVTARGRLGDLP
ncbi:MAG TPA: hypothetical protein VFZ64_00655 [Nocardioidaceae bacterium]